MSTSIHMTANRELYPDTNNTGSLGTSSYKWASIYATTVNANLTGHASQDLALSGGTMTGNIIFNTDNLGIDFFNGTGIYKRYGGNLTLKAENSAAAVDVQYGTNYYRILHSGNWQNYITLSDTNYLPLSGGTLSGPLTISGSTSSNMSYTTTNPRIIFSENGTQAVALAYSDWDAYRASKGLKVVDADNVDNNNVWFEVQGNCYAPTFVGSLSGNASSATYATSAGSASSAGNADTLDGYHADKYIMKSYTVDASSLSTSYWYPVTISVPASQFTRIEVENALNSNAPSWSTHSAGFSVRVVWETNGSGWGTIGVVRNIFVSTYSFANTHPVRGIGQIGNTSEEYVYVRGGGRYYFRVSAGGGTPTLRSSTYDPYANTAYSCPISPTTSTPQYIYPSFDGKIIQYGSSFPSDPVSGFIYLKYA